MLRWPLTGGKRTRQTDARIYKRIDKARAGVGQRRKERRFQRAVAQTLIDFVKRGKRFFFMSESLNELLFADGFVDERGLLAARCRLQAEHGVGSLGNEVGNDQRDRRNQHDDQRNRRVEREHEAERAEDGHDAGKELREAHQQTVGKGIDVGNHAADSVAGRVSIEIGERKILNMREMHRGGYHGRYRK